MFIKISKKMLYGIKNIHWKDFLAFELHQLQHSAMEFGRGNPDPSMLCRMLSTEHQKVIMIPGETNFSNA